MPDSVEKALDAIRADIAGLREAFAKHDEADMEVFREVRDGLAGLRRWAEAQDKEREIRQAVADKEREWLREMAEKAADAEEARRKATVFYGRMAVIGITAISAGAGVLKMLEVI